MVQVSWTQVKAGKIVRVPMAFPWVDAVAEASRDETGVVRWPITLTCDERYSHPRSIPVGESYLYGVLTAVGPISVRDVERWLCQALRQIRGDVNLVLCEWRLPIFLHTYLDSELLRVHVSLRIGSRDEDSTVR
jgi:hypothetical protein